MTRCKFEGCSFAETALRRGMCQAHYMRWWLKATPEDQRKAA